MQGNEGDDRLFKQARRLALMAELCHTAHDIALQALEQGEEPNMLKVFEQALMKCLERKSYNKDDLANVWAMLQLGTRAIRHISLATDRYDFDPYPDPPALMRDRQERPGE